MKHLSLFSGIGGIDLAAEWAGFESAIMVERDQYCQQVLKKNFPTTQIFDDVTTFNGLELRGTINLISAGFPCQPHSLAGKRKASGDERDLWGEVVRILGEVQPRWFLGENVPGLLSSESGRFFGRVVNDLDKMGYRMGWGVYGAKDVGAIHRRNRVFIVAYSKNLFCNGSSYQSSVSPLSESRNGDCSRVIGNSNCKPRLQSNSTFIPFRSKRNSRENISGRYWQPVRGGDWRKWEISPTIVSQSRVCGSNDGVPYRVDRLKALGNAVVPQQIYPILQEMARLDREL